MNALKNPIIQDVVAKWLGGDLTTWPVLKQMMDQTIKKSVGEVLLKDIPQNKIHTLISQVPDLHSRFIKQGTLDPRTMDDYVIYCAKASRIISVELAAGFQREY